MNKCSYEERVEISDRRLHCKLLDRGIPPRHALFKQLVKCTSVGTDEALRLGMEHDQLKGLLKDKVLLRHPNETYTFYDRHTATWFGRQMK